MQICIFTNDPLSIVTSIFKFLTNANVSFLSTNAGNALEFIWKATTFDDRRIWWKEFASEYVKKKKGKHYQLPFPLVRRSKRSKCCSIVVSHDDLSKRIFLIEVLDSFPSGNSGEWKSRLLVRGVTFGSCIPSMQQRFNQTRVSAMMAGPEGEERWEIAEVGGKGSGKGKDLFVLTEILTAALTCCPTGVDICVLIIRRLYYEEKRRF